MELNPDPADDPVLVQYPPVSKVPEGVTVQLHCALYNASVNVTDVHWYHQRPGNKSEWALSHFVNDSVSRSGGISDRFQSHRNGVNNSYILTISNTSISDTAVYNCSVWNYIYGGGTQLNVTDANPPVLIQSPSQEHVTEGQSARLWCAMKNARVGNTDVHWCRRRPGQDMEWVLTHEAGESIRGRPGFTERFQPSRDSSNSSFILMVTKVEVNDSADYYCRVWGDISGSGTRLTVIKMSRAPSYLAWIIVAVVLGVLAVTGGIFLIRRRAFRNHPSHPPTATGHQSPGADYENASVARGVLVSGGHQGVDSNNTYMALQRPTQSIYGHLQGQYDMESELLPVQLSPRLHTGLTKQAATVAARWSCVGTVTGNLENASVKTSTFSCPSSTVKSIATTSNGLDANELPIAVTTLGCRALDTVHLSQDQQNSSPSRFVSDQ
ncbi:uncharacterized protein LOC132403308 [Hypanus sabinus]|uniref:uncharacterized protein LOC132403308 n=1 Tax=Hypanus sabinus TaxID=79690 RepID=UPI0028C3C822|nr:uncharacterized protein LOC132403308 [Hypanus sabinus]